MIKVFQYLYVGIGTVGVAVITWGVILVTLRLLRSEFGRLKGRRICKEREVLRHQLGSYLILGLEFMIAADVIATVIHPTIKEIAVLASIVVIRTIISYFLDREMADSYFCKDGVGPQNSV
ncbi:MAG: DUF1622 domain-containing protein [Candidatus Aminicenantes bacterium]|nr:DUF1622 domain-containing protein [Candidatus Aminicenantes bacterium]